VPCSSWPGWRGCSSGPSCSSAAAPRSPRTSAYDRSWSVAIGNLLGSTVYNIALILGITVLASPAEFVVPEEVIAADLLVLAVVAVITVPVLLSGHRISRLEGGAFVAGYLGYLVWLTVF
jgi:Ca2+/Na+ antiporter